MTEWIIPGEDLGCDGAYFDYQEVVRCKDCKFASYEPYKDFVNVYICNYSYWTRAQGGRYPDWYCARAERRTDATFK